MKTDRREYMRAYRAKNRDRMNRVSREYRRRPDRKIKVQSQHRKYRYGITQEEFNAMLAEQKGRCAICERIPKHFDVDHCHATGRVRGLLCHRCNLVLAFIGDCMFQWMKVREYLWPIQLQMKRSERKG